jgi:hypothetical protein
MQQDKAASISTFNNESKTHPMQQDKAASISTFNNKIKNTSNATG